MKTSSDSSDSSDSKNNDDISERERVVVGGGNDLNIHTVELRYIILIYLYNYLS
jgi:hypothetical protein